MLSRFPLELYSSLSKKQHPTPDIKVDKGQWSVDLSKWWSTKKLRCDIRFYMLSFTLLNCVEVSISIYIQLEI